MLMLPNSVPGAIALMLAGMIALGTAPALWNQVERKGRVPSHTMLDCAGAYTVFATAIALTLGQLGPDSPGAPNFTTQLHHPNGPLVGFAVASGAFLALGDLFLQYAVAFLGVCIGPPLLNALTIIIGIALMWKFDGGMNDPRLVFPGMACAILAILLGALAHLHSATGAGQPHEPSAPITGVLSMGRTASRVPAASLLDVSPSISIASRRFSTRLSAMLPMLSGQLPGQRSGATASSGVPSFRSMRHAVNSFLHRHQQPGSAASQQHAGSLTGSQTSPRTLGSFLSRKATTASTASEQLPVADNHHHHHPHHNHNHHQPHQQQQQGLQGRNDVEAAKLVPGSDHRVLLVPGQGKDVAVHGHHASKAQPAAMKAVPEAMPVAAAEAGGPAVKSPFEAHSGQRAVQQADNSVYLGLVIAVVGGILYSLSVPCIQIAANDTFNLLGPGVPPLTVFTANFYGGLGALVTSGGLNLLFLYKPPLGTARSSVVQYVRDNKGRVLSLLSGLCLGFADISQYMGGQVAGYAASSLVSAWPIVGVLWGLVWFKEYREGGRVNWRRLGLLLGQVLCYCGAVGLLAGSAQARPHDELLPMDVP